MEESGPQWCSRFPGSTSPDDLADGFKGQVWAFLSAMKKGGASVAVTATYRPPPRAYLMHWCWLIGHGTDPGSVQPMEGVGIDWTHGGDVSAARAAAQAMVDAFGLRVQPSLTSRHTQGLAVDMTITWNGSLAIQDYNGAMHQITSGPHTGSNLDLVGVGASFGVIKLLSDPPHWSNDGH
ncbi:MAG: peptidoglycan-binding domain-containing protein [Alphaproteobacteria bacterium]|nr:peptidoglycan-binding domain-containing protein [Alphaproteobacteria bacterium]